MLTLLPPYYHPVFDMAWTDVRWQCNITKCYYIQGEPYEYNC